MSNEITLPLQPRGEFNAITGTWTLTEQWWCHLSRGRLLVVEPGFQSDGMSVPRFLWPLVGPYEPKSFPAAFCHDALYCSELVKREVADDEFRRILLGYGMKPWVADGCYKAVRWLGWIVWRKHTPESIAAARRFCRIIYGEPR
jgi:hypothetical protein